jgi:hypothetical protein
MPAGKGTGRPLSALEKKIAAKGKNKLTKALSKARNEKLDRRNFSAYWDKKLGTATKTDMEQAAKKKKK